MTSMLERIRRLTPREIALVADAAASAAHAVRQRPDMPWEDPAWVDALADGAWLNWKAVRRALGTTPRMGDREHHSFAFHRAAVATFSRPLEHPACELWCGCPWRDAAGHPGKAAQCGRHGLTMILRAGVDRRAVGAGR